MVDALPIGLERIRDGMPCFGSRVRVIQKEGRWFAKKPPMYASWSRSAGRSHEATMAVHAHRCALAVARADGRRFIVACNSCCLDQSGNRSALDSRLESKQIGGITQRCLIGHDRRHQAVHRPVPAQTLGDCSPEFVVGQASRQHRGDLLGYSCTLP